MWASKFKWLFWWKPRGLLLGAELISDSFVFKLTSYNY